MTAGGLLLFAATELLLSLSPGPAVLLVVSQAMRRGFRASTRGTAGILSGNAVYFAASTAGLGALLLASRSVFVIVEWAGAVYLILLGLKMLFFPASAESQSPERVAAVHLGEYKQGLLTQLANPKAIVFFTALLPQFIDLRKPMPPQFLVLGVVSIIVELPVLLFYGYAADRARTWLGRYAKSVERLAGACLVLAGVKLIVAHW